VDVIYFAGEGATALVQVRIVAWCATYGFDPDNAGAVRLRVLEVAPDLSSDGELQQLCDEIDGQGVEPKAIFLDTFARILSASGWEEITTDIGRFVHQAERTKRRFGCTVVMLHHTPVDDDTRPRGGGALHAAIGAEFRLRGNITKQSLAAGRAVIWAQCTKMQDGEKDEIPIYFRADRAHGALILAPITAAEGEALKAQRDERGDLLRVQVEMALAAFESGTEVMGPHLAMKHIELDEAAKVANGGYTHRTPDQVRQDAENWCKNTLNKAVREIGPDGVSPLHSFVVREPNGEPKRGPSKQVIFHLPPKQQRPSVGLN
jgi:hypothetical protein